MCKTCVNIVQTTCTDGANEHSFYSTNFSSRITSVYELPVFPRFSPTYTQLFSTYILGFLHLLGATFSTIYTAPIIRTIK